MSATRNPIFNSTTTTSEEIDMGDMKENYSQINVEDLDLCASKLRIKIPDTIEECFMAIVKWLAEDITTVKSNPPAVEPDTKPPPPVLPSQNQVSVIKEVPPPPVIPTFQSTKEPKQLENKIIRDHHKLTTSHENLMKSVHPLPLVLPENLSVYDKHGDHHRNVAARRSKMLKCKDCNLLLKNKRELTKHETSHSKDRPYKCTLCDAAFKIKASLKRHERVHTGIRPYKCEFCGKRFGHSGNLKVHMFVHTGERPFKCSMCVRAFTTSNLLKLHHKVHAEDHFTCKMCSAAYKDERSYKLHCDGHHQTK